MRLPIVHHPDYVAPLEPGHRFPMDKFGALRDVLLEEGLASPGGFHIPEEAPVSWLTQAHTPDYVDGVLAQTLPREIERRIGLPITERVARRGRLATGGTVLAARLALEHGIACNTAGGSHHARAETGAGFCVFNDVAVAVRVLMREGIIRRVLIIDLDVHQGDGTAAIFTGEPKVFTLSMHAEKNFPVRKVDGDLDLALPDGMEDVAYLDTLAKYLPRALALQEPDMVFYNAGVDPHKDDRLGRLSLSDEGLAARDRYVLSTCLEAGVPVTGVIGGGYGKDVRVLAKRHATLHRAADEVLAERARPAHALEQ